MRNCSVYYTGHPSSSREAILPDLEDLEVNIHSLLLWVSIIMKYSHCSRISHLKSPLPIKFKL